MGGMRDPIADFHAGNLAPLLADMKQAGISLDHVHSIAKIIRKYDKGEH